MNLMKQRYDYEDIRMDIKMLMTDNIKKNIDIVDRLIDTLFKDNN